MGKEPKSIKSTQKRTKEEVYIVHEDAEEHNCPVCGHSFIIAEQGFDSACEHIRHVELDLIGEDFISRKKSKRLVTYFIDDSDGPFGGRLTVKVDLGDLKDDPEDLYWKFNKPKS